MSFFKCKKPKRKRTIEKTKEDYGSHSKKKKKRGSNSKNINERDIYAIQHHESIKILIPPKTENVNVILAAEICLLHH